MGSNLNTSGHDTGPAGFRVYELGKLKTGGSVEIVELHAGQMRIGVSSLGARIVYVETPDRRAEHDNISLRYPSAENYESDKLYLGATVGRVANRIRAGECHLGKTKLSLSNNDSQGGHHLHGGRFGLDSQRWQFKILRSTETPDRIGVAFTTQQPDGHEGYPGRLEVTTIYTLDTHHRLGIEYRAQADATTLVNLTNHAYWNLSGRADGGASIGGHMLELTAEEYLERSAQRIPTGVLQSVEQSEFDFRTARPLEAQLSLFNEGDLDHYFVIPETAPTVRGFFMDAEVELRSAATLIHPGSGRCLEISTDQPGLQVYAANSLSRSSQGRWRDHGGLCLETHGYPDAPNHPEFPSIVLERGHTSVQRTQLSFSVIDQL